MFFVVGFNYVVTHGSDQGCITHKQLARIYFLGGKQQNNSPKQWRLLKTRGINDKCSSTMKMQDLERQYNAHLSIPIVELGDNRRGSKYLNRGLLWVDIAVAEVWEGWYGRTKAYEARRELKLIVHTEKMNRCFPLFIIFNTCIWIFCWRYCTSSCGWRLYSRWANTVWLGQIFYRYTLCSKQRTPKGYIPYERRDARNHAISDWVVNAFC